MGLRTVLAVNLQLRPPALSNYQLTPLGSAGGTPGRGDLVHARGGSENQGGGPGGPCTGNIIKNIIKIIVAKIPYFGEIL
jgi:hypothetical protein